MEGQLWHPKRDDAKVVETSESVSGDDDEMVLKSEPRESTWELPTIIRGAELMIDHPVSGDDAKESMITREDLPEMSGVNDGVNEQCIYVVPQKVRKVNPEAYTPQVVSIGPFHNPDRSGEGDNFLKPMEELKPEYLKGFLNRTRLRAKDFDLKLKEWEKRIRSCYAGLVNYNSDDFLKMILIDACFIIEHFLRCLESSIN